MKASDKNEIGIIAVSENGIIYMIIAWIIFVLFDIQNYFFYLIFSRKVQIKTQK